MKATIGEEIFNSITHGVGAVASLLGLILLEILAFRSGNGFQIIAFSIYGVSLFLLFLFSTLYHGIQAERAKKVFRLFDHIFIYLLIAGTYTPILLLVIRKEYSLGILIIGLIWVMAVVGILLKIFLLNNKLFSKVDLVFYLSMGWLIILVLPFINGVISLINLLMLLAGGIFYSAGTVFYRWHKLKFHHAYWHMFVLCGSLIHFLVVLRIY